MYKKIIVSCVFSFILTAGLLHTQSAQAFTCGTDAVAYGGKNYTTVQIGTQCWFKENLNVGTMLASGATMPSDPAPTVGDPNTVSKWCYNNDVNICNTDGALYTYAEVNGLANTCNSTACTVVAPNQGICPTGWHIPSDAEYKTLEMHLGMTLVQADDTGWRGTNQGTQMKTISASTFSAVLSGYRFNDGGFYSRSSDGFLRTDSGIRRRLNSGVATVNRDNDYKDVGFSARCVKTAAPTTLTVATSNISESVATGNGNISDTGGENPTRLIEWGTASGVYINSCSAGTGSIGAYSCSITGLAPNTTYYVRAKATNAMGTVYGSETSFTTPSALVCGTSTVTRDSVTYGTVVGADGKCWLDRNLGATRVATAFNDSQSYGWLFQWGRGFDGHQNIASTTTVTSSATDVPGHAYFITDSTAPHDWRTTQNDNLWQGVNGINNPCPTEFRLPTQSEWTNLISSANITNYADAFGSPLKLTAGGSRSAAFGSVNSQGAAGLYWSSTPSGTGVVYLSLGTSSASASGALDRAYGFSVRCVRDSVAPSVTTQATSTVTSNSANGNGNITSTGNEYPTRQIEWGTTSGIYTNSCSAGTGGTGAFSCALNGLSPNTTYYIRAKATNSIGTVYGTETSFTTTSFVCGSSTIYYGSKNYATVLIGEQCWFRENLNVGTMLASGATMPTDPAPTTNTPNTVEKWCYNNDTNICATDGGLYTWAEANGLASSCNTTSCTVPNQNQGICPTDWHLPTDTEYKTLEMQLGMTQMQADATSWRGTDQGSQLSTFTLNGNNSSGFTFLLAGNRYADGSFSNRNLAASLWSASASSDPAGIYRILQSSSATVGRAGNTKTIGYSVRCIKNATNAAITTSATTSITSNSAIGNGNVTATGGENPTRQIEWGTTSGSYASSCTAGTGFAGSYSCALSGLLPNTTYYVRAKATNSAGTVYGSELSFTTSIALPTVTTQAVSSIAATSAIANATITTTGAENPMRSIEYGTQTGIYTQTCSAGAGAVGTYTCDLTNLTPNTQYFVRAKATNSAGTTYGEEVYFTTNIALPTLTTTAASNITPTQAKLHATLTTTGGENPTRQIIWGTEENALTNTCDQGVGTTGDYTCIITNLTPNTQYFFTAQAINTAGTAQGDTLSFTTQDIPQEVTITNPNDAKIDDAIMNAYFAIQQGTQTHTEEVKTNTTVKLTTTQATITLPPNTTITEENNNSFNFTNFQTTNITQDVKQQNKVSHAAVKIGVPNTKMAFSQPITLALTVGEAYNGKTMNILYQEDGETTWNSQGTCIITNGQCTFQTDHATTYTVNGDGTISGAGQNDITTDVQDVLSLDCDHTGNTNDNIVEFGNLTPGTPVTASTTCTVTTNSDAGYTLAVRRNDINSTMDKDSDATTDITDRTPWDSTGTGNATTWNFNDTNLAFTVYNTTATKNTTWWGTGTTVVDVNNKYAGFPTSYTDIMQHTEYDETATTTQIGYKLDVPTTQKSGIYSGDITYQVVTAP